MANAPAELVSSTSVPSAFFADGEPDADQNQDRQRPIASHRSAGLNNLLSNRPMCSSPTSARAAFHAHCSLRSPFVPGEPISVASRPQRSPSRAEMRCGRLGPQPRATPRTRTRLRRRHQKSSPDWTRAVPRPSGKSRVSYVQAARGSGSPRRRSVAFWLRRPFSWRDPSTHRKRNAPRPGVDHALTSNGS